MIILGIESSCDESAAAVLEGPRQVLSNVVSSQIDLHGPYGGVVPEIACREHVRALPPVIEQALGQAGKQWKDIDAIAVTAGPGLAGSLLVGWSTARALSRRLSIPCFSINHLHGHMFSAFLTPGSPPPEETCPFVSLIVSGGHTCLVRVDAPGKYHLLGQTIDDAAGEAFDKGANLLGLGYPGGPAMDRLASKGNPLAIRFPRGRIDKGSGAGELDPRLCFSFSGLKTSLRYHLQNHPVPEGNSRQLHDVAASYQEAIIDALVRRVSLAMQNVSTLTVGGGVCLNSRLRSVLGNSPALRGKNILLTDPAYGGDNAAMIAMMAALQPAPNPDERCDEDINPNLPVAPAG